jgi:hypothetical protein
MTQICAILPDIKNSRNSKAWLLARIGIVANYLAQQQTDLSSALYMHTSDL